MILKNRFVPVWCYKSASFKSQGFVCVYKFIIIIILCGRRPEPKTFSTLIDNTNYSISKLIAHLFSVLM